MSVRRLIALLLFLACSVSHAQEAPWSRLVVFGDSLSDPGNAFVLTGTVATPPYELIPQAPYALGGLHFSNGPTWVEQLAQAVEDESAGPALRAPRVFSNYAVGAARARDTEMADLNEQLALFLQHSGGVAPADALYVIMVGGNDVRDALAALAADPSGAGSAAILQEAVGALGEALTVLARQGARHVLVASGPDIALVPAVSQGGPLLQWPAAFLSQTFNLMQARLLDELEATLPLSIHRLDLAEVLHRVVADPQAYGLLEVARPCITPGVTEGAVCSDPDAYLFWDGIHPTRAGHALVARAAAAALGLEVGSGD